MAPDQKLEAMIETFERSLAGRPNYAAGMIGLAEVVARKEKLRAYELARKALGAAQGDPEVMVRGRRLLHSLTSAYHVRMMNDARRNLAWDKALRAAIGPDTHALEIGAGAGMLALMAARAGARKVTTCETDPVVAQLAREIVAHNGYAERVDVIGKASTDLVLGEDLDEPADLIFCDIFGDGFFDFKPLTALADARRRLSRPQARVAPAFGAIRVALADWAPYPVEGRIDTAAGFDLTPFAAFAPARITVPLGSPDLRLLSGPAEVFRFDLAALTQPPEGRAEVALAADADATVTGIVQWIRLELDAETVLEARPEPGARFFSAPRFWPLPAPLQVRRGQEVRVCAAHDDAQLRLWRPL